MPARQHLPAHLLRDHARPRHAPAPTDAVISARLTEIVQPATYAVAEQYRRLGLRERTLTLPIMVSLLVSMVWRQIPGISPLARVLSREHVLWTPPLRVSQQALNVRIRTLPATLFAQVVHAVLPQLAARAQTRTRPQPAVVARVASRFTGLWAVDATTLEALFKKVGLVRGIPTTVRAGKLLGVLDIATKLPVHLIWDTNADLNERSLLDRLKPALPAGTLLLLDKGFFGFPLFDWFTAHGCFFVIPDRQTTVAGVQRELPTRGPVSDAVIKLGMYRSNPCTHLVRRITIMVDGKRYAYLTNVLDPETLGAADVIELYRQRWRIEEAFLLTKRLLGLSYLWTGAVNGIGLQIWSTWLLYAILVDVSDAVADELDLPLGRISLEMVFRGLYFYVGAAAQGLAADPVTYLASQTDLGIVKRPRPPSALDKALASLS